MTDKAAATKGILLDITLKQIRLTLLSKMDRKKEIMFLGVGKKVKQLNYDKKIAQKKS